MSYQAFYRAYRPQSFAEMSGQSHIKQTLQNALLYNKTTHAYLFSGPRGTGKTSAAKIFAKALNCENGPAKEPCNTCETCKSITEGSNTDVIEFDAASNSRVEEMREIIEKVRFAPSNARFKVYIIDEVHMLSTSAFNALLKTLEEPPAHAVFILATTEPHKIPLTIISRCQRFDFKRITSSDIVSRMKEVLTDANIEYDENVLKVIAQAAAGGMRDALSMLDQVVSFSGEKMTLEDALLVTGSIGQDVFFQLANALIEKDVAEALSCVEQLIEDGKDPVRLTEDFITFYRDLLVLLVAPEQTELLEIATGDTMFQELASKFAEDTLYKSISILTNTQQEMRFSNHAKVYLETAIIRLAQVPRGNLVTTESNSELELKVKALESQIQQLQQQISQGIIPQANAATQEQPKRQRQKSNSGVKVSSGRIQEILKTATKSDIQTIKAQWANILQQLQKSHAALLNDAEPVAASSSAFVLKFKYEIHCQMAMENKTFSSSFPQLIANLTGTVYEVVYVPEENWLKIREEFIRQNGLKPGNAGSTEDATSGPTEAMELLQGMEEISEDPLIVEAEKLFGKEFVEVHDD
ncbi:DNA polymerase III subunit gamma/tau [Psychrobacillus sp. NEAU-3TGS]|uniref:DNA polymerase III subunit gamma/tau n=1 Tax=Psychrobacillus sp. NEAU-3TGS TaxID=2995412 RepID=UPI002498B0D3|nr:DNA polymerase III subunit gamma/tau [Psychrobacillus sp. NEAU-3TGS]MDI2585712.1 DNA polymerase III subunit gamma/tau [Psychrobacillus sp. NEAU-3TGS]